MIRHESGYEQTLFELFRVDDKLHRNMAFYDRVELSEVEIASRTREARQRRDQLRKRIIEYETATGREEFDIGSFADLRWRLAQLRIAAGVTQRELAKRLGIDESGISHAERHEYRGVSLDRVDRILRALNAGLHAAVFITRDRRRRD